LKNRKRQGRSIHRKGAKGAKDSKAEVNGERNSKNNSKGARHEAGRE
jgi:hypothetical protein